MPLNLFVIVYLVFLPPAAAAASGMCFCGNIQFLCKCGCKKPVPEDPEKCCNFCPGNADNKCFPGDVTVLLDTGKSVQMKRLVTGQRILSVQNGKRVFSEVRTFFHRQPEQNRTFFTMITEQGHQLSLSEFHVLFTSTNKSAKMETRFARSVKPGDYVFNTENCPDDLCPERVVHTYLSKKQGFYSPLTETGTIVINNILTSCFANVLKQDVAQFMLAPFRWFQWVLQPWQEGALSPILTMSDYIYQILLHDSS